MADKNPYVVNQEAPRTLTDEQIVTERKLPRRSFLAATGAVLVGGAAALVSGMRAAAQDAQPPKTGTDPDKKKDAGSKSGKPKTGKKASTKAGTSAVDPDKTRPKDQTADPDKAKPK